MTLNAERGGKAVDNQPVKRVIMGAWAPDKSSLTVRVTHQGELV